MPTTIESGPAEVLNARLAEAGRAEERTWSPRRTRRDCGMLLTVHTRPATRLHGVVQRPGRRTDGSIRRTRRSSWAQRHGCYWFCHSWVRRRSSASSGSPPFDTSAPEISTITGGARDAGHSWLFSLARREQTSGVRWIGQDGHDYVGPSNQFKPSDIQDIRIRARGLDPRREVVFVEVTGQGDRPWQFNAQSPAWTAEFRRKKDRGPPTCSSSRIASRRDGRFTSSSATMTGRRPKPTCTVARPIRICGCPNAALAARWIGQDRQDWAGRGRPWAPMVFRTLGST